MMEQKPDFKVPNLERALLILEFLVQQEGELSQREIALTMGFPVNSVMRILNAMEYYGYLHRNKSNKKYSLSNKLSTMARNSASQRTLMEASLEEMRALRDKTEETVVVSILDGSEGLILEQVQGIHAFRFVCDPGTRQTLHCSASCKAILAFIPRRRCLSILKNFEFKSMTPSTITNLEDFQKELEEVRLKGYALDRAEDIEGVYCAAAPIMNKLGDTIAAITTTGPANRMPLNQLHYFGETVKEHAQKISHRLGYQ